MDFPSTMLEHEPTNLTSIPAIPACQAVERWKSEYYFMKEQLKHEHTERTMLLHPSYLTCEWPHIWSE